MPPPAAGSSIVARFSGKAVVDFALTSTEWAGPFGFVTFRLHRAMVDGNDVSYVQTDVSDRDRAQSDELMAVPKLAESARPTSVPGSCSSRRTPTR